MADFAGLGKYALGSRFTIAYTGSLYGDPTVGVFLDALALHGKRALRCLLIFIADPEVGCPSRNIQYLGQGKSYIESSRILK